MMPLDLLVVGAGVTGLVAGRALQERGLCVRLFDKGRRPGGRLASRVFEGAAFDHGAQFVTARDPRFAELLASAQGEGALVHWCDGFDGAGDGHPRYRGAPTMNALAAHLARGLDVVQAAQVMSLRIDGGCGVATVQDDQTCAARAVLLTAPVPQSLALLDAGGVTLDPALRARLDRITYERCFAVMARLARPSRVPPPGGLAPAEGPIAWLADNQHKGISAEPAVTLHATPSFSLDHWDDDPAGVGRLLLRAAEPWIDGDVRAVQVHRWRYSRPLPAEEPPCVVLRHQPLLVLAGDAFGGARVEGAAISGWAAAGVLGAALG